MAREFERRVGSFTWGTTISRVLGLSREAVFAHLFGVGFATDAFNVAFRIPNLLRDLFAESALSAAFVPVFVDKLAAKQRTDVWRFASNLLTGIVCFIGLVVIAGILTSPGLVRVIGFGFGQVPGKLGLTTSLTRIIFPFLLWVALAAWAMGILNSLGGFFLPALAPGCFNLISILVALGSYGWLRSKGMEPILGMAWGVMLGGLAQFLVQLPPLFARGFRYSPRLNLNDTALRRVFRLWVPLSIGFAAARLNVAVDTFLASLLEQGSITYLNYGYRVMHLPLGLFGVAVGSVALPELSHRLAAGDRDGAKRTLDRALRMVGVLTIPTSILLIALANPICGLIYQHGRFTPLDTHFTAQALALYSLGIWATAATRSVAAAFYALKDTKTPTWVGLGVIGLNAGLNLALMGPLRFRAFALTTSICAFINLFLLWRLLGRRLELPTHSFSSALRILLLSLIGGAGAWAWAALLPHPVGTMGLLTQISGGGLIGLAGFYLFSRLLGIPEVDEALKGLLRR